MAPRHDDDFLDGCDLHDNDRKIRDEDTDGVVLFADVDPNDTDAVERRELEYVALFAPELHGFTKEDFRGL